MKLQQDARDGRNQFTTFAGDHVGINGEMHRGSLLVTPQVIEVWRPARFELVEIALFSRGVPNWPGRSNGEIVQPRPH